MQNTEAKTASQFLAFFFTENTMKLASGFFSKEKAKYHEIREGQEETDVGVVFVLFHEEVSSEMIIAWIGFRTVTGIL